MVNSHLSDYRLGALEWNLPSESSQFSLTRPTRLDKIKNFHLETGAGLVG